MCLWSQTLATNPLDLIPQEKIPQKYPTFKISSIPLVDSLVRDHLVLGKDIPVVAQEILGLLSCQISMEDILNKIKRIDLSQTMQERQSNRVQMSIHDVDEGRGSLQVLKVDVPTKQKSSQIVKYGTIGYKQFLDDQTKSHDENVMMT